MKCLHCGQEVPDPEDEYVPPDPDPVNVSREFFEWLATVTAREIPDDEGGDALT